LNKRPELKKFVKFGGADCFENVHVEFQHGQKAVLTIYHNDEEKEQVELQSIQTAQEIHEMMLGKGFRLKAPAEVDRILAEGEAGFQKELEEKRKREEKARQKMENLKTRSKGEGLNTESMAATTREALERMKKSGREITPESARKLEQQHNQRLKLERNENIDAPPTEEQTSINEKMRQWKQQQWKRFEEKRKHAASVTGDEL
jgi:hypothetical protein